jgi:AcrR family transcriptional regulator
MESMARPQSPDYDRRREAILDAAAHLYAARGFAGASIADLARSCGTSKSLVYHYFPAKDDILYAVMTTHLDDLVAATGEASHGPDAAGRLRSLARAFMKLYMGAEDRHKVLLNELDSLQPARRAEVIERQRHLITVVEGLVAELRPGKPALPLAMLFFGMINWTHTWFRAGGPLTAQALADLAVELMAGSELSTVKDERSVAQAS